MNAVKRVLWLVCGGILLSLNAWGGWSEVYEARNKGLPKTAIEALEPILADALEQKRYPEAIKAICTKIAYEEQIEGNKPEEHVARLQAEIERAPAEMKPLMQAILANRTWNYFQQNRWRIQQRTQTAEAPGNDFTTWDLPRILAEIDKQFTLALANDAVLKQTRVEDFDDLLEKGTMPDSYRPTLYDFIAHEALTFYQAGEQGVHLAEDVFEITDDSPVFSTPEDFMRWDPQTTDTESPALKAVRLFQNLLAFHQNDADQTAFIDADLLRLTFAKNQAVGPDVNERTKAALKRFSEHWKNHEISARALHARAKILYNEDKLADAFELAKRGAQQFPESKGGIECDNLMNQIKEPSAQISTERVWGQQKPTIDVTYKNINKVYFRAVEVDFDKYIARKGWSSNKILDGIDSKDRPSYIQSLIEETPAAAWETDLPATDDYQKRTEAIQPPKTLAHGFYIILSSHNAGFTEISNQVSAVPVWVGNLALVVRANYESAFVDGFVLDSETGEPIVGATVRSWKSSRNGGFIPGSRTKTDSNGMFRFTKPGDNLIICAEHAGQRVATGYAYYVRNNRSDDSPSSHTVFFTDRALYRPGQTISFKGICYRQDQRKNNYRTLSGESVIISLLDQNDKEVARQQLQCNDYGAFSGAFTAPAGGLTGYMSLQVETGPSGSTYFRVEEYKRPKFQVNIEHPAAGKLDDDITLTGKARAYTGAAIGGAKVSWRVVREVRFPPWCWWGHWLLPPNRGASQNIAHGSAVTETDGSFQITFNARPDRAIPEASEPTFTYTIHADVTDTTGETRSSSQTVRLGYTAMAATFSANDWQTTDKPVELTIATRTLDGEPLAASGTVSIYTLKQPENVMRPKIAEDGFDWLFDETTQSDNSPADATNPRSWELDTVVITKPFQTDATGTLKLKADLKPGIYRAMLETQDRFGKTVTARTQIQVVNESAKRFPIKIPHRFAAPSWSVEPGDTFRALWGTGYDSGRAFIEIEQNNKLLRSFWTNPARTQQLIEQAVTKEMRGGFTVRITYVRENRAYLENRIVDVPWSNKQLSLKWEHFTSKLKPGQQETWTAVISGPDAQSAAAEMVATLYDASLDQFSPHSWLHAFDAFRREGSYIDTIFENSLIGFQHLQGNWPSTQRSAPVTYRHYPSDISDNLWRSRRLYSLGFSAGDAVLPEAAPAPIMASKAVRQKADMNDFFSFDEEGAMEQEQDSGPDLNKVSARKNLNETAFFFPHLTSGDDGTVRIEFTMPEALTEWKFMGFAHDQNLRSGFLTGTTVTAKEFMVEPNPPRFVREGDILEFTVKVSNQSPTRQTGTVRLTFADARTLRDVTAELDIDKTDQTFDIPSMESRTLSWRMSVPDGMDFLTYKAVGATDRLSDGEKGFLPVLSKRILVTESLPLPIRGKQTKQFEFSRLLESQNSTTLQNQNLTVQMVSQPAWYAVMALPYLMEYPHECSEQIFSRLYANSLARHIADSDPDIRRIFDLWKNTPALDSPLEKNQQLKSVMIEETPWLRQAQNESQARRNVGILFNENRLNSESERAYRQLEERQLPNGLWPWFPGNPGNPYISLTITTGFGRMRHLGADDIQMDLAIKSLRGLDDWMDERYHRILKGPHPEEYVPGSLDALYLYGRSFFLNDRSIDLKQRPAVDFFLAQSKKYWLQVNCRLSQGHLAIALKRFGDLETPVNIMNSIKERSVTDEEMGMFWRDQERSWWWFRAPIETQALMIEAFDEVMGDAQAVEDCKVWLLKQKQTQDWKTTKATADAIYGLLLRGTDLLASDALVEVSLGGERIEPENVEAGTGFYEQSFVRGEIKPEMGHIEVKKSDDGVSWGSAHWQYLEDVAKITPHEGTPLKLKKSLYRKVTTKKGPVLEPVTGPVSVGDELVCRIELRTDRDMEYVHLKDQRGSGTEPVNVLSRNRYQDGLAYYESTRDTATHFFIHYLPKGTYVFETSVRVQLKGSYQSGIATIECMYAPEFNSHSESIQIDVE